MRRIAVLLSIVCGAVLPGIAVAAFPSLMNFQGRLDDAGGNPLPDGSYSVTFRIFDSPTGGELLWDEVQNVTAVDGVFSVLLGGTDSIPDVVFYEDSVFLEIQPQDSDPVVPRWRLASVPYSWRAKNADMVNGQAASELEESSEIQSAISAHTAIPDAHHSKTINASELILGTLAEGRLPQGAIDSTEIELESINAARLVDEPGLSHAYTGATLLSSTMSIIDSVLFTVPKSGWLLIMANGYFMRDHIQNAGSCAGTVSISSSRMSHSDFYSAKFSVVSGLPSGPYQSNFTVSQVLQVNAGSTKLFLLGDASFTGPGPRVEHVHLNALYVPTVYGNIDPIN